jgi:cytochrome c
VEGQLVYEAKCQACHGAEGEGTSGNTRIVGGDMQSADTPIRTVGSFWPYATTIFDYVRRAMPADAPKSLTDTEVYQVTAYVLYMNGIINQSTVLNSETLAAIEMPNREGFIDQSQIQ